MKSSMVAKHARWPKENDIIFNLSERAQLFMINLNHYKIMK